MYRNLLKNGGEISDREKVPAKEGEGTYPAVDWREKVPTASWETTYYNPCD